MEHKYATKASITGDPHLATPLHNICAASNVDELEDYIPVIGTEKAAIALDADGNTPLLMAVKNPNITKGAINALGKLNPEAGKIENLKGRTPFHVAIRSKADESIVKAAIKVYPKAVKVIFKGNNNIFHEMCQYETGTFF
jgi:ankyrin repeat protein